MARNGNEALRAHLNDELGIGVRLAEGTTFIEDVEARSRGDVVFGLVQDCA